MDRATVEVYERGAVAYAQRRWADQPERARSFAAAVAPGAIRVDLGAGPGHYLPHLGRPVVATDAALAMLAEARRRHPGVPAVACDLEALPFRRGAIGGVWASKSLQHIPPERLPLAAAGLHRVMAPGAVLDLTMFAGDGLARSGPDSDLPGRLFTRWQPAALHDLLVGAGFELDGLGVAASGMAAPGRVAAHGPAAPGRAAVHGRLVARARRVRTLPDTVGPGMRLLICGLNPSLYAADAGVAFARPGNRFWPAALASGLVSVDRDPDHALRHHSIGMTDLVKRATVAADELTVAEYRSGLARVERLVRRLRPGAVCFVGLVGWRAAVDRRSQPGPQAEGLAGVPVYVMPSTSGLNARSSLSELEGHLRTAATLAGK